MTKDLTLKEKEFAEAFAKLYKTGIDMAESDIKCLSTMIKFNEERVKNHYDSEPLKFFKKKHEKWEEELNEIREHLHSLYESFAVAMDDYHDLIK